MHEIYVRDAPGVVFVRAQEIEQVQNPFDRGGAARTVTVTLGSRPAQPPQ